MLSLVSSLPLIIHIRKPIALICQGPVSYSKQCSLIALIAHGSHVLGCQWSDTGPIEIDLLCKFHKPSRDRVHHKDIWCVWCTFASFLVAVVAGRIRVSKIFVNCKFGKVPQIAAPDPRLWQSRPHIVLRHSPPCCLGRPERWTWGPQRCCCPPPYWPSQGWAGALLGIGTPPAQLWFLLFLSFVFSFPSLISVFSLFLNLFQYLYHSYFPFPTPLISSFLPLLY